MNVGVQFQNKDDMSEMVQEGIRSSVEDDLFTTLSTIVIHFLGTALIHSYLNHVNSVG